jgi:hypothetical protein
LFKDQLTNQIVEFLTGIGLEVEPAETAGDTFLPGILVKDGRLLVDESKLLYRGDLLHEAGHLAVTPPEIRRTLSDEVEVPDVNMDAIEAHSIAWSYAAALHLGLDPRIVFHPEGYLGRSEGLLQNFYFGVYPGLNGLIECGMALSFERARELGAKPYPHMLRWLRD